MRAGGLEVPLKRETPMSVIRNMVFIVGIKGLSQAMHEVFAQLG
jgi:hypothetical protein